MHTSTSYQQPENIFIPQPVPASQNYDESEYRDWLEHAIKLNRALISSVPEVRALAEHILPELIEIIEAAGSLNTTGTKNRSKLKEAVKAILINLYVAYLLGQPLHYFGIQQIEFTVNAKNLHRVFNKSKFTLGGRFYGAYHETIPKKFRRHIKIDGQDTVEWDYKAHHLRMPYHLLGIDYQDDPYMVLATDDNERKIYKKLCLIAINAENETKAIQGFREKALEEGFDIALTNETIRSLLDWLKIVHHPIAEYIHSKKGLKLQYLDSQITEAILMSLTKQGIPCLPVHDSYIVPGQYEEQLQETMMNEYKKLMGFEPVIERA